jgi:hypothetical protein
MTLFLLSLTTRCMNATGDVGNIVRNIQVTFSVGLIAILGMEASAQTVAKYVSATV